MLRPTLLVLAALALPVIVAPDSPKTTVHGETPKDIPNLNLIDTVQTARAAAGESAADGIPAAWCGDETTSNGTANAPFPADAAQIKVVYAFAADRPNRAAGWQDALQANVSIVNRYLAAQAGGTKALRFDMGTRCGPQYVDLQVVALPGAHAAYVDNFRAVAQDVQKALGNQGGARNAVVLADSLSSIGSERGLAETITGPSGEVPGPQNPHNNGALTAVLFTKDGGEAPGAGALGFWPEGFLHEITHTLGAVQWGAPHSTQPRGQQNPAYGHCWQGVDVMCYAEDQGAASQLVNECGPVPGAITVSFDCGRDDYFSPAPAPGSYLATHWNTYDSAFLAPCDQIAPACGGGEVTEAPTVPTPKREPKIKGSSRRGATLKATPGEWINQPTSFKYRWQRLTKNKWVSISGAGRSKYRPSTKDIGRKLRVTVAATNDDGTMATASAPTKRVVNRPAKAGSRDPK
ncbi:hypothetical protein OJ997_16865 [Solirubrobacter phytolaccae]|uniref:Uncharacterized protein n=1 Tax=Solirubrobacter phytolaccae TaxID=1404360 RepID=A0A9X3N8Z0_9ACTN|nr:hypothetical protein [Solirubrobacter phytolaccae]MDA0181978.1 hypothetical protein [Solirubrobacter phytolaccae]